MVVDNVENYRDAAGMRGVHQPPQTVRPAIALLDREDESGVVAPGNIAGKFIRRHHRDGVGPEILQIIELADDSVEIAAPAAAGRIEQKAADMQLVDNQLIPRRGGIADA